MSYDENKTLYNQNDELKDLREKIAAFNDAYEKGQPIVEDFIYDFYKKKLKILEEDLSLKISHQIGPKPKSNEEVKHLQYILSLNHDFGKTAIEKFVQKISKKNDPFPFVAELKIDGVSIVARYENKKLKHIATRGNGEFGQDISHLKDHLNLPNTIDIDEIIDLRCEAYIHKDLIKNPRNAVAGMLMKKEPDANLKFVQFAPHNLYTNSCNENLNSTNIIESTSEKELLPKNYKKIWNTYMDLRDIFKRWHLNPIEPHALCHNLEEMYDFFDKIENEHMNLPFEIDGIVFKINDYDLQMKLGNTDTAPRAAFAIKFDNPFAISKIKDIQFQVGRFGRITPVAIIDEAIIKEKKIQKATLNNFDDLIKNNYAIGDIVKIEMAGQVIPMISEIIEKGPNELILPKICPSCNRALEEDVCTANWECIGQMKERLYYFAKKQCLNIEGMGEKQVEFFVDQKIIQYPYDFFEIKNRVNAIKTNPTWLGPKSLANLLDAIEKSKHSSLESWYISLGLPNIGSGKANSLTLAFPNFSNFMNATQEDLQFLGPEIARSVFIYKTQETWIAKTWEYMKIGKDFLSDEITLF